MWPVTLHQMKRLQIECTSYCNAFCPSCEREKYPYENPIYNRPLNTHYLSIENFVEWFDLWYNFLFNDYSMCFRSRKG